MLYREIEEKIKDFSDRKKVRVNDNRGKTGWQNILYQRICKRKFPICHRN